MADPTATVLSALRHAQGGEQWEAYLEHRQDRVLRDKDGRRTTTVTELNALSLRLIAACGWATVTTSDLTPSGIFDAVAAARRCAAVASTEAVPLTPARPVPALPGIAAPPTRRPAGMEIAEHVRGLVSAAGARHQETVLGTRAVDIQVASTQGVQAAFRRTFAQLLLRAGHKDTRGSGSAYGIAVARHADALDLAALTEDVVMRARQAAAPEPVQLDEHTALVLNPYATAMLLEKLARILDPSSPAEGRATGAFLPPGFALLDDPCHPMGPLSAPIDDTGVPTQVTYLTDGGAPHPANPQALGRLRRPDLRTAPQPGMAMLRLQGRAVAPVDTLVAGVEHGVLVHTVRGLGSGRVTTDLDAHLRLELMGVRIRGGAPGGPVRCTARTTLRRLCSAFLALGQDLTVVPLSVPVEGRSVLLAPSCVDNPSRKAGSA